MEPGKTPKRPRRRWSFLFGRSGFLSALGVACFLLHATTLAAEAPASADPPAAIGSPLAATGDPLATAVTRDAPPVTRAAPFPNLPAKVPLTVVGTRVALEVKVGGQALLLGLDSCKEGLRLFASGTAACSPTKKAVPAARQHQQQRQPKQHNQQQHAATAEGAEEENSLGHEQEDDLLVVQRKQQQQHQQRQQKCYDPDLSLSSMWCLNWREVCTAFAEPFFVCRASKQHDPKFAAKYRQIVDGVVVSEVRLEGLDTVELDLPSSPAPARAPSEASSSEPMLSASSSSDGEGATPVSVRLASFPVKLVLERQAEFDAFGGLDGVWGIAGPDLCCREASLWNLLVEPTVHAVGFNINLPSTVSAASSGAMQKAAPSELPSFLHFGEDPAAIFGEMLWAERIQTGAAGFDALMHFSTYDWKLCGEQVGHPLSSNWEAIVDLSSECLVVPPPLWRSLRAWLPVDVDHELCKDPDTDEDISKSSVSRPAALKGQTGDRVYRRTCPLLNPSERRPLPSISFSLTQSHSESPRIQIPLEKLVIQEDGIGEVLCVVPQPFLSLGAEQWRQIRFGTRVLSALNVVMDRVNWRVGLQEKNPQPRSDVSCAPRAACIGDQVYVPYTNRCADPDCSVKILFEMNTDTKVCELAWWVPGAVVTAVGALVTLEFLVLHLRKKVVSEACSGRH